MGCSDQVFLEGSVDEILSLEYSELRLRMQGGFVVVQYVERSATATQTVCKLAIDAAAVPDDGLLRGESFDSAVTLTRATSDSTRFPPIERGSVRLDDLEFSHGAPLGGEFSVEFVDNRTLRGGFSGKLVEVIVSTPDQ